MTDTAEGESDAQPPGAGHRRSINVTSTTMLWGIIGGAVTPFVTSGPSDRIGLVVLAIALAGAMVTMRVIGV
ncbi:MAG: hypothetical protein ABEI52_06720, partial [Halobacteriaceae archaeon]